MKAELADEAQLLPTGAAVRKLFTLAATFTRREADGSRSVVLAHGFRIATSDPGIVVQHWLQHVGEQHPGFSLSGKVSVMEITQDDLAMMGATDS